MTRTAAQRGRYARSKGAAFEREVASAFRAWLGDDWTVRRIPADRQRGRAGTAGDVECVHPERPFPFAVECKAGGGFHEGHLWRVPPRGPVASWWDQACDQAKPAGLRPMLVMRRNAGERLVMLERDAASALGLREGHRLTLDGPVVVVRLADLCATNPGTLEAL